MITGVWKGKIGRQKAELKIIQNGDSLTGTSYYYESSNNYRRYSIRGYFDPNTNAAVWWDDRLLEERSGRFSISTPGKIPMLSRADFNCPGDGRMMLEGSVSKTEDETKPTGNLHLDKIEEGEFSDEWDFVISNYITGANDPYIIDSISALSVVPVSNPVIKKDEPIVKVEPKEDPIAVIPVKEKPLPEKTIIRDEPVVVNPIVIVNPPGIEEKFIARKKIITTEIPLGGDSIELRFYDNAEIDGDSISLFLNEKLIFQHVRLTGNAFIIKLPVSSMLQSNELIMVAENLGTIPPNTSFMVALVEDRRYEARLESTEGSSAGIRFIKK